MYLFSCLSEQGEEAHSGYAAEMKVIIAGQYKNNY
jgi:hypothetical protein